MRTTCVPEFAPRPFNGRWYIVCLIRHEIWATLDSPEVTTDDTEPWFHSQRDAERACAEMVKAGYTTQDDLIRIDDETFKRICYEAMAW